MDAKHKILTISVFILGFLFLNPHTSIAQCDIDDWTVLKAFYEITNGDNWSNRVGWEIMIDNQNSPPTNCNLQNLFGVTLGNNGRVLYLDMSINQLSGSIPPELGNLNDLTYLDLYGNQLNGGIPPELGNLSNLTYLDLYGNQLNGSIPAELGTLSNLTYLDLYANQFSGSIPAELGNLSNLTTLSLSFNQLSGDIPQELGGLSNLTVLNLRNNAISDSIPSELGNLSNLTYLDLGSNQLTGNIPTELYSLGNLEYLHLSYNQLSGSLLPELLNLSSLVGLTINHNNLSGCYDNDLMMLCMGQLTNSVISNGNNFDALWEDFCDTGEGVCVDECALDCVYPGDINYDGIVNNKDIALAGLYLYEVGTARDISHQNGDWYAHPASDWNLSNNQNKDIKHHDSNGDGIIDESDWSAIKDNMNLSWQTPDNYWSIEYSDYQVLLQRSSQVIDNYLIADLVLDSRQGNDLTVRGGYFTIDYSEIEANIITSILNFEPISWLGIHNLNLWYNSTHFPKEKKIEVGFTRIDNIDRSGSGVIGQLVLELENDISHTDSCYVAVINAGIHNENEFIAIENQTFNLCSTPNSCLTNCTISNSNPFPFHMLNEYLCNNTLHTEGPIAIGETQQVIYKAPLIKLNPGFKIHQGANFRAIYGYCD